MILDIFDLVGTQFGDTKALSRSLAQKDNCFVGWVDSYNETTKTVNVLPGVQSSIIENELGVTFKNKQYLLNCWVVCNTLDRVPQKGDKCLLLVLDEKSNNFFKAQYDSKLPLTEQTITNLSKAYKSISNCVAIIINPNPISGGGGGSTVNVYNGLDSESTTDALSANQGRILNGKILNNSQNISTNSQNISTNSQDILGILNNTKIISPKDGETASLFMGSFTDTIISNNRGATSGTAIGNNAKIRNYGTAIGNLSDAGNQGVAVGRDAASSDYGVAIGYYSLGSAGVAVGHSARGYNIYSVAVGRNAKAENNGAIQIGYGTNTTENSVQFRGDNIYNIGTHTLTVQNAQVGGDDVVTKSMLVPTLIFDTSTRTTGTYSFLDNINNYNLLVFCGYETEGNTYTYVTTTVDAFKRTDSSYQMQVANNNVSANRYMKLYYLSDTSFVITAFGKFNFRRVYGVK